MTDHDLAGAAEDWQPAFPGQRPPFEVDNELAVRHGANSPRRVGPIARELVEQMLTDPTVAFLREPAYAPAVWAWGRAEARCLLLTEYLGESVGDLADERVAGAYRELHRAETRAASLRVQLGLTPLARARLGKDVAQGAAADAVAMLTRAREEAERRAQEGRGGTRGGGPDE